MKKLILLVFLTGLICLSGICQTAVKKMPVTTSSDKARELFIQARDLKENIEYVPGDKLLRQAIELDPDFALAHIWLLTPEGAKKAMELIRFVTPGEAFLIRSLDALLKADPKVAEANSDSLVVLYPNDKSALFFAGFIINQSNQAKGVKYLNRAIALDPNYAAPYNMIGYYYMEAGNFEEAGKALRKYLELQPKSGNAHDSYGDFLSRTGKYAEAIAEFRKAYENEPSFSGSMVKAGWIHIRQGEFGPARKVFADYGRTAANDDERLFAILQQALTAYVEGNMKQAFADLDAMKKMAIEVKNPWYTVNEGMYKGMMLLESGDPAGAIRYFVQVQEMIPSTGLKADEVIAANFYNHGFQCMALAAGKKLEKARQELALSRQIFESREKNIQDTNFMNLFQGSLEILLKNYKQAIEFMEPGAIKSASVSSQYYTGLAYDRAGNVDKAIEYYTKANESANTTFTAFYLNKTKKRIQELKKIK